jgi:hypothetical protein
MHFVQLGAMVGSPAAIVAAVCATLARWGAVLWPLLAVYAPVVAKVPAGFVGIAAGWAEAAFGSSASGYLLRLFSLATVPDALRAVRGAWSTEGSWSYWLLSYPVDSADAVTKMYRDFIWSLFTAIASKIAPDSTMGIVVSWYDLVPFTWVGLGLVGLLVLAQGPGVIEYAAMYAAGDRRLPRRNFLTCALVLLRDLTPIVVGIACSQLFALARGVWVVLYGVLGPVGPAQAAAAARLVVSVVRQSFSDTARAGLVESLTRQQLEVAAAIDKATRDGTARHSAAEVARQASLGVSMAVDIAQRAVASRRMFGFPERYVVVRLALGDTQLTPAFTSVAFLKDDLAGLHEDGMLPFQLAQHETKSVPDAACVISPFALSLMKVSVADKTGKMCTVTRTGSSFAGASRRDGAAGAPRVAPDSARTAGLPLYSTNLCWAAAVAAVLSRVTRALLPHKRASDAALRLADPRWVREHGAAWVATETGRGAQASDASEELETLLRKVSLSRGPDAPTLASLVCVSDALPEDLPQEPLAALVWDHERTHWSAAVCEQGEWWLLDAESENVGDETPEADLYIWLAPDALDAANAVDSATPSADAESEAPPASAAPTAPAVRALPASPAAPAAPARPAAPAPPRRARPPAAPVRPAARAPPPAYAPPVAPPAPVVPPTATRAAQTARAAVAAAPPRAARVGGAPPAPPVRDLAAKCRCGAAVRDHGADQWSIACGRCRTLVVGACANMRRADRDLYGPQAPWYCAGCIRAVGTHRRPREPPVAPAEAPIAAPLPRSLQEPPPRRDPPRRPPAARAAAVPPPPAPQFAAPHQHVPLAQCGRLFRCGQATCPPLAALKGDALIDVCVFGDPATRADTGKSFAVRQRHRAVLRRLKAELAEPRFATMSLPAAIVTLMRERAQRQRWKAATFTRELANAAGALQDLPLYTNSPVSFGLQASAEFRDAMRASTLLANEEQVGSQPAAAVAEVRKAVARAPDVATKVALVLTWVCAGRVGDVLKVKRQELVLEEDFAASGAIKITFCRGKGARFSQPYTVPTVCPQEWRRLLLQFITPLHPWEWLFPGGTKRFGPLTNAALRAANPTFTVRALRRGALQALSHAGVPTETLLVFSGHKRVDTLLRYLNCGAEAAERTEQARTAALHLAA